MVEPQPGDRTFAKYLIIGAGPTGLGAAHRLAQLGERDFLILEKNPYPGGLSASFEDARGFTWDIGGHVTFSHYEYFDRLLEDLLSDEYLSHQRKAFIRIAGRWLPYPFQNNIRYLPPEEQWKCIEGLLEVREAKSSPEDFREWILSVFGPGIARLFMFPYNFKVWACPPERMDWRWIGERVSVVDLKRVLRNITLGLDDVSWGPNNTFRFPLKGGTGVIFERLAKRYRQNIRYSTEAGSILPADKLVQATDGQRFTYSFLLNTGPLDRLVLEHVGEKPTAVKDAAAKLEHNGVHVVGIGVDRQGENDTCWMYFPEGNCPFYRVTNFHHYSPHNTPDAGRQTALMGEISFSQYKPGNGNDLVQETLEGLSSVSLLTQQDRELLLTQWQTTADYGYPIPTRERDSSLRIIQPWLEHQHIYSRGRFGGWKYEVGNMDHSVMQGVEWADRIVLGKKESTYGL